MTADAPARQERPGNDAARERLAARLRGFGPLGLLAIFIILAGNLITVPLSAIFVLTWVWLSKTPWREIGLVRPRSWIAGAVIGIAGGVALKFFTKAVVLPLLGADPVNQMYHYIAGNPQAALEFAVYVIIGAGFSEETVFRGYFFERLGKLFGQSAGAKVAIVVLTSALFGVLHYQQGLAGIEQATLVGLIFGSVFAITGRLYTLMIAHAAFDLTAVAMIYYDVEIQVSHLIFK